jgi:hypothetical protein
MVTEEEIAELMKTPEGMQILRSMMDQDEGEAMTAASGYDNDGNLIGGGMEPMPPAQIGASPDIPGATRGLPPETIGASPDIPGATRGLPPEVSGINPEEENEQRRMRMMEQLLRNRYGR